MKIMEGGMMEKESMDEQRQEKKSQSHEKHHQKGDILRPLENIIAHKVNLEIQYI